MTKSKIDLFKCTIQFDLVGNSYKIYTFVINVLKNKYVCLNAQIDLNKCICLNAQIDLS